MKKIGSQLRKDSQHGALIAESKNPEQPATLLCGGEYLTNSTLRSASDGSP